MRKPRHLHSVSRDELIVSATTLQQRQKSDASYSLNTPLTEEKSSSDSKSKSASNKASIVVKGILPSLVLFIGSAVKKSIPITNPSRSNVRQIIIFTAITDFVLSENERGS